MSESMCSAVNLSSSSIQTPFMQFSIDKNKTFRVISTLRKKMGWNFNITKCETIQGGAAAAAEEDKKNSY